MQATREFLKFNGKALYMLAADGQNWVALKPICEAMGVDYHRQQRNIREDENLFLLCANQHIVGPRGKLRKYFCLPERYIYGWLFSIRSESPDLWAYKKECYDLLYNHFHGVLTERLAVLREKSAEELALDRATAALRKTPEFELVQAIKNKLKGKTTTLKTLDEDLQTHQLEMFL